MALIHPLWPDAPTRCRAFAESGAGLRVHRPPRTNAYENIGPVLQAGTPGDEIANLARFQLLDPSVEKSAAAAFIIASRNP
jgi:hypothetical protein